MGSCLRTVLEEYWFQCVIAREKVKSSTSPMRSVKMRGKALNDNYRILGYRCNKLGHIVHNCKSERQDMVDENHKKNGMATVTKDIKKAGPIMDSGHPRIMETN